MAEQKIALIAALTNDYVIGKDNKLLWDIPEEMKFFKTTTTDATVIMGRKTFESIGRPLPKRHNIVLTAQDLNIDGVETCTNPSEALFKAKEYGKPIFIIGGAKIYELFLKQADTMYLSWIKKEYEGDTFFPKFNTEEWEITETNEHEEFIQKTYQKK